MWAHHYEMDTGGCVLNTNPETSMGKFKNKTSEKKQT